MRNISIEGKYYLRLFWITILLSFVAWIVSLMIEPQGRQLDLFFLRMSDFWADGTNPTGIASDRNPYYNSSLGLENAPYPPFTYIFFYFLAQVSIIPEGKYLCYYYQPIWTLLFTVSLSVTLMLLFFFCINQFKNRNRFDTMMVCLVSCCLSFPMLFTIERGNIFLIVAVLLVSIFIFYYDSSCLWKKECALLCLALASAGFKLSPAVFGILLFYNKDWWAVCRLIAYGIIIFFVPFLFFKGGLNNFCQFIYNLKLNLAYYMDKPGPGLIASYIKYAKLFFGDSFKMSQSMYLLLVVLRNVISFFLLFGAINFKEKWKMVLNVTLVLLIFPAVSQTYSILYMIPFTILFFSSLINQKITGYETVVFLCLIMIYFVFRCNLSYAFNFNFAVLILIYVGIVYSLNDIRRVKF